MERSKNIIRKKFELRMLLNKNDYTDTIVKITFKKNTYKLLLIIKSYVEKYNI